MAVFGEETWKGTELARVLQNKKGGIQGREIQYVSMDAPDIDASVIGAERLITREGVKIIVGTFSSSLAMGASVVAEKHRVIYWETNAWSDELTQRGLKYFFRLSGPATSVGESAMEIITNVIAPKLGKRPSDITISALNTDDASGVAVWDGAEKVIKQKGLKVLIHEATSPKTVDFTSVILRLKAPNPDVVYMTSGALETQVRILRSARDQGLNPKAFMCGPAVQELLIEVFKGDANGIFISDLSSTTINPKGATGLKEFKEEYAKMYGKPGLDPRSLVSFSSCLVLWKVLESIKNPDDPEQIREAAYKLDLPLGSLPTGYGAKIAPPGDPMMGSNVAAFMPVVQIQDGQFVTIYPEHVAMGAAKMIPLPPWGKR